MSVLETGQLLSPSLLVRYSYRVADRVLENRGSAIGRIAGKNVREHSDQFEERVPMWVFQEQVRTLSHLPISPCLPVVIHYPFSFSSLLDIFSPGIGGSS